MTVKVKAKKKTVAAKTTTVTATTDDVVKLLNAIDGKLEIICDYVMDNSAPVEDRIAAKAIDKIVEGDIKKLPPIVVDTKQIDLITDVPLVNQQGESVDTTLTPETVERLNFDTVKAEAQLLCNIEKETTKAGFHKAKAIISSFGVGKLQDLKTEFYEDIVSQFRTEVKNWK